MQSAGSAFHQHCRLLGNAGHGANGIIAPRKRNGGLHPPYASEAVPVPPPRQRYQSRPLRVEDEAFYDATSIAGMRIGCLPGNARNAVAMAATAANTQADKKT